MASLTSRGRSSNNTTESIEFSDQSKSHPAYLEEAVNPTSDDEVGSLSGTVNPAWTENTDVPRRRMGMIQVSSLVINQLVDSSMLSLPGLVLATTGSKLMGIGLWTVVGFYTLISGFMFCEYSSAYPYTGGPLIWLDEIFHRPAMLAPLIFAWYWVLLATTCGVTRNVATELLRASSPTHSLDEYSDGYILLAAITVISVTCLSLYFARRLCFAIMSIFAVLKIIFVFVVFIAGLVVAVKRKGRLEGGLPDWYERHPSDGGVGGLTALVYVSFTFQGWEHTNYIAGEIKNPQKSLKKGIFSGLIIVWILYTMLTVVLYATLSYDEIVNPAKVFNSGVGYVFANEVFGAVRGTSAVAAMASFTCNLALTYTFAKVRQAIAWQRIVPFYKFTGRQDRQFDSPGGALLMQWFFTVIQLAFDPGWLYTYGFQIESAILAIGLLWIGKRMRLYENRWKPHTVPYTWMLYPIVIILVGFNMTELVTVAMGSDSFSRPNFWMLVGVGCIAVLAIIHWIVLRLLSRRAANGQTWGQKLFGVEVKIHTCGDDESELSDSLKALLREARADGTRRRVEYKLSGRLRVAVDRIREYVSLSIRWLE